MAQITLPQKFRPPAVYAALSLAVLLPMLSPGYILTLDMAFTPVLRMPEHVSSSYTFNALLHYLNLIVPSQVIQKTMLFLILLISALGMHCLVCYVQKTKNSTTQYAAWAAYIAGALYMINPFTYSRFMAGQYAVLLGYMLLPFFVRSTLQFFAVPTLWRSLTLSGWAILISIVSIHTLGLAALFALVVFAACIWRHRAERPALTPAAMYVVIGILVFVASSAYWLFPLLNGSSSQGQAVAQFGAGDRLAFQTVGSGALDKLGNVLQLQGFWAEGQGLYLLPGDQLPGWPFVVLMLWIVVGIGAVWLWRRQRATAFIFICCALIAIVVAVFGVGGISILNGFREPQKFAGLVALAYALLAGLGAAAILDWAKQKRGDALFALLALSILLLPVLLTPTMFWGYSGQLSPRQYPADWYAMNERLNQDQSSFGVLSLPWHLYMHYPFAGRVIVNPTDKFFDKPTISSNELEFDGASPTYPDATKKALSTGVLPQAPKRDDLGTKLAAFDIKYILLAKTYDYRQYEYLDRQADLKLVAETPNSKLYRNLAYE